MRKLLTDKILLSSKFLVSTNIKSARFYCILVWDVENLTFLIATKITKKWSVRDQDKCNGGIINDKWN